MRRNEAGRAQRFFDRMNGIHKGVRSPVILSKRALHDNVR